MGRAFKVSQKGFTFLEVMLSIIILVVGTVVLLQTFSTGIFADADVENNTKALWLAQEKMEQIRDASTYASIDSYAASRANIGGAFADFDREVIISGNPKQIQVNVTWNVKGADRSVSLTTLAADYDF